MQVTMTRGRPLKVKIHRSTVPTDGFHIKSIIVCNNPNILTNYRTNGDNNNDDDKTGDDVTPCK